MNTALAIYLIGWVVVFVATARQAYAKGEDRGGAYCLGVAAASVWPPAIAAYAVYFGALWLDRMLFRGIK